MAILASRGVARTPASRLAATCTAQERARASRYRRAAEGVAFLRRRAFLRHVVGRLPGCPPARVPLVAPPGAPPALEPACHGAVRLSAASSGTPALVAVSTAGRVGVDVERCRSLPDPGGLAAVALAPAEREALERLPADRRAAALLRAWTRREACLKAAGLGLAHGPERVRAPRGALATPVPMRLRGTTWWVRDVALGPAALGALATRHRVVPLCVTRWDGADLTRSG